MDTIKLYVKSPNKIKQFRVVNDIHEAVEELKNGNTIARFEYGDSMSPILSSGEYCVVEPIRNIEDVKQGDAVLCNVNGYLMTHMVIMVSTSAADDEPYFLIGDTHMNIYGWTKEIYGIAYGTNILEVPIDVEEAEEVKEN